MDERNFTQYMSRHEIEGAIQSIAERLNVDYAGKKVVMICVLKGAYVFCADLIRKLEFDVELEFVRLSSYGKARQSSGTVTILKDIAIDIRDKHVLIIEEIIDSGRTLKFLYERLQSSKPESVEIVSLLDKANKRIVEVPVKYVGKLIEDQFLIGYGLDLEEKARNSGRYLLSEVSELVSNVRQRIYAFPRAPSADGIRSHSLRRRIHHATDEVHFAIRRGIAQRKPERVIHRERDPFRRIPEHGSRVHHRHRGSGRGFGPVFVDFQFGALDDLGDEERSARNRLRHRAKIRGPRKRGTNADRLQRVLEECTSGDAEFRKRYPEKLRLNFRGPSAALSAGNVTAREIEILFGFRKNDREHHRRTIRVSKVGDLHVRVFEIFLRLIPGHRRHRDLLRVFPAEIARRGRLGTERRGPLSLEQKRVREHGRRICRHGTGRK